MGCSFPLPERESSHSYGNSVMPYMHGYSSVEQFDMKLKNFHLRNEQSKVYKRNLTSNDKDAVTCISFAITPALNSSESALMQTCCSRAQWSTRPIHYMVLYVVDPLQEGANGGLLVRGSAMFWDLKGLHFSYWKCF